MKCDRTVKPITEDTTQDGIPNLKINVASATEISSEEIVKAVSSSKMLAVIIFKLNERKQISNAAHEELISAFEIGDYNEYGMQFIFPH